MFSASTLNCTLRDDGLAETCPCAKQRMRSLHAHGQYEAALNMGKNQAFQKPSANSLRKNKEEAIL